MWSYLPWVIFSYSVSSNKSPPQPPTTSHRHFIIHYSISLIGFQCVPLHPHLLENSSSHVEIANWNDTHLTEGRRNRKQVKKITKGRKRTKKRKGSEMTLCSILGNLCTRKMFQKAHFAKGASGLALAGPATIIREHSHWTLSWQENIFPYKIALIARSYYLHTGNWTSTMTSFLKK